MYFHVIIINIELRWLILQFAHFARWTLKHVECPHVKEIWYGIEEWFSQTFDMHISFDRQAILFGKFANKNIHKVENLIILVIKQYIYINKFSNVNKLSIEKAKKRITDRIIVEKVLLQKHCRYKECERHWQNIHDKLD
jgi:hypothetical protein